MSMKRFIAMISVAAVLATFNTVSFAEGTIDFSSYTDSELIELLGEVQAEIADRRIEKTAYAHPGAYTAGVDFPAGIYIVEKAEDGDSGYLSLRAGGDHATDVDDADSYKFNWYISRSNDFSRRIVIEEGDILQTDFPITLTIDHGLLFE